MTNLPPMRKSRLRPQSMRWSAYATTWMVKALSKFLKRCLRLDIKSYNKRAVPTDGPVIIVGGHWSFSDPLLWGATVPRNGAIMAKNDLWWNPITGPLVRMRGDIAVKRGSDKGRLKAQRKAENILAHGGLIGLFPPGSISPHGQDRDWRKGFAEMAIKYQASIVTIRLNGSGQLYPLKRDREVWGGKAFNRHTKVEIIYSEPITPEMYAGMTAIELTNHTRQIHDALVT